MKLTMLGTGVAQVTECYNTCFLFDENGKLLLVDGGGGVMLLRQFKKAGVNWKDVKSIFVTHKHTDHLLGVVWMIRLIVNYMDMNKYEGEATIYSHREVIDILVSLSHMLFPKKQTRFIGQRLHFISVEDGQECEIINHGIAFFDIHSTKATQFGFSMNLAGGRKLTCCGDEPFCEKNKEYVSGSAWLMHEAFCLHSQADIFNPYSMHHSTVKNACQLAEQYAVENLILYHTEDKGLADRKRLYTREGAEYFSGNLYVPDDLDSITIL